MRAGISSSGKSNYSQKSSRSIDSASWQDIKTMRGDLYQNNFSWGCIRNFRCRQACQAQSEIGAQASKEGRDELTPYVWVSTCMNGSWGAMKSGKKWEQHRTTPYKLLCVWTQHAAVVSCQFVHIYFKIYELWRSVVNCCWNRPDVFSERWLTIRSWSGSEKF